MTYSTTAPPSWSTRLRKAPESLGMETPEDPTPEVLEDLTTAEKALQTPIHLPPKALFQAGPAVHV